MVTYRGLNSPLFETLKTLTELPGMAGSEKAVNAWLHERWEPHVEDLEYSGVGNLIAHAGGSGPALLIEAHADEIGFLVKSVDDNGFLWIEPCSAQYLRSPTEVFAIGQPAAVETDTGDVVDGFFAALSGHAAPAAVSDQPRLGWSDVFLDIGATSAAEVRERGVAIGSAVVWSPTTRRIGQHVTGKAMDDRAGLTIITELLPRLDPGSLKYNLYLGSVIQEEMGLVGASSVQRSRQFDLAICLDVAPAGDVPGIKARDVPIGLGHGPVLVHHDTSVHYHRPLIRVLAEVAGSSGLPVQHAVLSRYGTDGVELIRGGIPTALIGLPTRYTHSPFETVAESDIMECVRLLEVFLTSDEVVDPR